MNNIDSRRRERHEYDKNILCFKCQSSRPHPVKVPFLFSIKDISYGGLGIITSQNIPLGSIISFKLTEGDDSRVFDIIVKWSKFDGENYIMGTEFNGVVKEDIVFLFNVIKKLA